MQNYSMFQKRIYRSPDGIEGNGAGGTDYSASAVSAPSGGDGSATAPAAAAPVADSVRKSDFEAFASRMEQNLSRMTPRQEAEGPKAPGEPNVKDYDFQKPGELLRYQRDNYNFFKHQDKEAEAKTSEATRAKETLQKNEVAHRTRYSDYLKANPDFSNDLKSAAGKINVTEPVKHAIFGSKSGPMAIHFMAKNPGADEELNLLADTDGPEAVRERIGEMAAEMRLQKKASEANTIAAGQRPPRQNLRGGSSSSDRKLTNAERFERFHKG